MSQSKSCNLEQEIIFDQKNIKCDLVNHNLQVRDLACYTAYILPLVRQLLILFKLVIDDLIFRYHIRPKESVTNLYSWRFQCHEFYKKILILILFLCKLYMKPTGPEPASLGKIFPIKLNKYRKSADDPFLNIFEFFLSITLYRFEIHIL